MVCPVSSHSTPTGDANSAATLSEAVVLLRRIAVALERGNGNTVQPNAAPLEMLETRLPKLDELESGISDLRTELAEIKELLVAERGEIMKESYTVEEVAKKTKLASYTIRQACNTGRIQGAYKARDRAWRIPHSTLLTIQNEGLPPA